MNRQIDKRLKALEVRRHIETLRDPGPDATEFEQRVYALRLTALAADCGPPWRSHDPGARGDVGLADSAGPC